MITDRADLQQQLFDHFDLARWAPPVRYYTLERST